MGHNIEYGVYPENVDKKKVEADWNNYVAIADRMEGCSGLYNRIRWLPIICESEADAYEAIRREDSGNYDQLAVRFRRADAPTAKLKALQQKFREAQTALCMLDRDIHYSHTTTKFVSCKKCGSSLAREYIKSNFCPMCCADLRPQTVKDKVKKASEKVKRLEQQILEEEKKANKKGKLFWLVKIEYHT